MFTEMTIMSTNTRELDINSLIYRAAQLGGLMSLDQGKDGSQWLAKASFGRDMLESIVKTLQVEGIIARDVIITSVTLDGVTGTYTMSAGTIDVVGEATYKQTASSQEFPVRSIDREEWMAIADKAETGAYPTRMWVERRASVKVYLHPIPNVVGSILQVQRKAILADNSDGARTVDLEVYWMDYLMKELAYRFSAGMPIAERSLLRDDAKEAKKAAQTSARQTVPNRIELCHPTPWSR